MIQVLILMETSERRLILADADIDMIQGRDSNGNFRGKGVSS